MDETTFSIGMGKTMKSASASPTDMTDLVGKTFGKDRVVSKIGEGGMGSVWLTEHAELKIHRALKTMPPGFESEPELVQRFRQEAEMLAQLRHRNIAQIHDFGNAHGVYYFIMEYLPGGSLRSRLQPKGTRLPWRHALHIVDEVCAGLEYAHGNGIIHRDIKPENILFDDQDHPRIADFGLGKILGQVARTPSGSLITGKTGVPGTQPHASQQRHVSNVSLGSQPTFQPATSQLTMQGQVVGTVDYMSPEQRRGRDVTAQSDIYALGVTLYEMLTGELPTGMESLRERGVSCPRELEQVIKRMLTSSSQRFTSVTEVRHRITTIGAAQKRRRRTWLAAAAAAAAAAGWLAISVNPNLRRSPDAVTYQANLVQRNEAPKGVVAGDRAETIQKSPSLVTRLKQIATGPAEIKQTIILSWARDTAAAKAYPAVGQVVTSAGTVLGNLSLVGGDDKGFDHGSRFYNSFFVSLQYLPVGAENPVKICEFRIDDPVGQTRVGEASDFYLLGQLADITKTKDTVLTLTVQITLSSSPIGDPPPLAALNRTHPAQTVAAQPPPATANAISVPEQTIQLEWLRDATAEKQHPSSAQIIDKAGNVLGDVILSGVNAGFGSFPKAALSFKGQGDQTETVIVEFRQDDPIGQRRQGKASGIFIQGSVTGLTKSLVSGTFPTFDSLTIQVRIASTAQ